MRIALVNAAGALAVVGASGGFALGVRWSVLVRAFGVSLIYANTIGVLLALAMPQIARRCRRSRGDRSGRNRAGTRPGFRSSRSPVKRPPAPRKTR